MTGFREDRGSRESLGESLVGVLALQGSFGPHAACLERCGVQARLVRRVEDLEELRGLIVPGGESTTLALLMREGGLFEAIGRRARAGLSIFGTCAGAILMGRGEEAPERWGLVDVDVRRNAYGRQIDSFTASIELRPFDAPFRAIFIRAPKIGRPTQGEVLGELLVPGAREGEPVLVRQGQHLLASFHPELTDDLRVHRYFLKLCGISARASDDGRV